MMRRLELVQFVRAVAIIFVMLGHLNVLIYKQFSQDWFGMGLWGRTGGVDLFFVISGFMITYIYSGYIGTKGKSSTFFLKRLTRIVPFYWLVTIGAISIFMLFPQLGEASDRTLSKFLSSLFFLTEDPILIVSWSLTYIVLFYCTFSLLIAYPKTLKFILIIWLILSLFTLSNLEPFNRLNSILFGVNNLEIWAGAFVGFMVKKYSFKYDYLLIILGMCSFLLIWINNSSSFVYIEDVFRSLLYGLSSCAIILGVTNLDLKKKYRLHKSLTLVGDASYSIFLTHGPFLQLYIVFFVKFGLFNLFGINFSMIIISIITILTGLIIYKFIESPMNNTLTGIIPNITKRFF